MTSATLPRLAAHTIDLGPGVRLHVLRTRQFTTTMCRITAHRPLDAHASTAAVLAKVLQSATEQHPTRRALAERLAELYGAALHVGVGKLGDRQLLSATLEWPTAHVVRSGPALAEGLALLRDVWCAPVRGADGALSGDFVAAEQRNLLRALAALRSDKAAWTLRALVQGVCRDEPFARDARGGEAEARRVDTAAVTALHQELIRRAPIDIWLVGDVTPRAAERAVRRHLLWPGRAARARAIPRATGVRGVEGRPYRRVLTDGVTQQRIALAWRGNVRPSTSAATALVVLGGVLGGGSYGRLFKVVREVEGLCYDVSAHYTRAKGLLMVQTGVDPANESRALRSIRRLLREVASGRLDAEAHAAYLEDQHHRVTLLAEARAQWIGWLQEADALGLPADPAARLAAIQRVRGADVRRAAARLASAGIALLRPGEGGR